MSCVREYVSTWIHVYIIIQWLHDCIRVAKCSEKSAVEQEGTTYLIACSIDLFAEVHRLTKCCDCHADWICIYLSACDAYHTHLATSCPWWCYRSTRNTTPHAYYGQLERVSFNCKMCKIITTQICQKCTRHNSSMQQQVRDYQF